VSFDIFTPLTYTGNCVILISKFETMTYSGQKFIKLTESREHMEYTIETEQEVDGRWIAEITDLPGVLAYGATEEEAMTKVEALALRVLAERLETNECRPMPISISLAHA
jgi:predicted RNase H-like HicB family nuclease